MEKRKKAVVKDHKLLFLYATPELNLGVIFSKVIGLARANTFSMPIILQMGCEVLQYTISEKNTFKTTTKKYMLYYIPKAGLVVFKRIERKPKSLKKIKYLH